MTIQEALAAQHIDNLTVALDTALREIVFESPCGWSVFAIIDALEVVDVLAASLGRPPPQLAEDTVAFLIRMKQRVATPERVELARRAVHSMRSSPTLDERMHDSDPESWAEIYAEALAALS